VAELGHYAQILAWFLAGCGILAGAIAGRSGNEAWLMSARNATLLVGLTCTVALVALGYLFYVSDFSIKYVWQFSNRAMESNYKVSAIWGGMDGSMLLWCTFLALAAAVVAYLVRQYPQRLAGWALSILNVATFFFLTIVVFYTNPFRYLGQPFIPPDGNGLNPLLQNIYMQIHPPSLYVGFTLFTVPYAFCLGALLAGETSNEWIRLTRRWTLVGWGFLTAGIMLGGHWAYLELGWGGFWAWDPVENASFMPWLTATAFLHSVMVQERKNMLKMWNVWLIVLTYALTIFGTFLTRSGVVQSVHAFAETDVGEVFLQYLALVVGAAIFITWKKRDLLKAERSIESFFSRESAFLLNNLVFLSICFATLWGVIFPILSEAVTGTKQTVSIPFFNAVNVPLFIALLLLMGIGPMIAWKKATLSNLKRAFLMPTIASLVVTVILLWAGVREVYPLFAYVVSFFALMTIMVEYHKGVKTMQAKDQSYGVGKATSELIKKHRSRYGGYLIHVGVVVCAISITASMAHKIEKEVSLAQGESIPVGRFNFKLDKVSGDRNENYEALITEMSVFNSDTGALVAAMHPEKRFYLAKQETTTEVALRMGPREDIYIALAGWDDNQGKATYKIFINPLQVWLWVGGLIMILGTGIVMIPDKKKLGV
jgi:cytochrome c-type biogenesis protein CcmF